METSKRHVLYLDRYRLMVQSLAMWKSECPDGTIRIRVEWDGESHLGTFQVQNSNHGWDDVGNLSPITRDKDGIVPMPGPSLQTVMLHFERGPMHGATPFEAWARPIRWIGENSPPVLRELPSDTCVVRETDYAYTGAQPQIQASTLAGGIQTVRLSLDLTHDDYEIWVKLRHPTDADRWCTVDPIVGQGDRNGTPIPKLEAARASDRSDTSASG